MGLLVLLIVGLALSLNFRKRQIVRRIKSLPIILYT